MKVLLILNSLLYPYFIGVLDLLSDNKRLIPLNYITKCYLFKKFIYL